MKIDYTRKSFLGVPYGGTAVSLSDSDIESIIGATTGVVKVLAIAGAAGLGLSLLGGVMLRAAETPVPISGGSWLPLKIPKIPIGQTLVQVKTLKRTFLGFCIDENIEFKCEDDQIKVPTSIVNSIIGDLRNVEMRVELIDGSQFRDVEIASPLKFMSIAGTQKITFPERKIYLPLQNWGSEEERWRRRRTKVEGLKLHIQGASISHVAELRENLTEALSHNLDKIIEIVGEDILSQYFNIHEIKSLN